MSRRGLEELAEVRERIQDAKLAMLGVRTDVIRLLFSLAPLIDGMDTTDPVAATVLRETLAAVIIGLELEGVMGGDKVDVALAPDAAVKANVAKWRITLSRAAPPLHRYSRILEQDEVEQLVQAVRAGLDGQPTFHAKENGHEVGTPIPYDPAKASSLAALIAAGLFVPGKATEKPKGSRHG